MQANRILQHRLLYVAEPSPAEPALTAQKKYEVIATRALQVATVVKRLIQHLRYNCRSGRQGSNNKAVARLKALVQFKMAEGVGKGGEDAPQGDGEQEDTPQEEETPLEDTPQEEEPAAGDSEVCDYEVGEEVVYMEEEAEEEEAVGDELCDDEGGEEVVDMEEDAEEEEAVAECDEEGEYILVEEGVEEEEPREHDEVVDEHEAVAKQALDDLNMNNVLIGGLVTPRLQPPRCVAKMMKRLEENPPTPVNTVNPSILTCPLVNI